MKATYQIQKLKYVEFYVSNAKQAASYYITRFGFEPIAYKGLETGSKEITSWVVCTNNICLLLTCALGSESEVSKHALLHGDSVKDISFQVNDIQAVSEHAKQKGCQMLQDVQEIGDGDGKVLISRVQSLGGLVHTFIQNINYKGVFLPGFIPLIPDPINNQFPKLSITHIDHIVKLQKESQEVVDWYQEMLQFHLFQSIDDSQVSTEFSGLRSLVMSDDNEIIKIPVIEPAYSPLRKGKGQIEEFLEYHVGPGIQHIALQTDNIVKDVDTLRSRGVQFLSIPDSYYVLLKEKLSTSKFEINYEVEDLMRNQILVDMCEDGYLFQLFSKPCSDRPTFFVELIERHNNNGFGIGNFKSLYEALEAEQIKRGTLLN